MVICEICGKKFKNSQGLRGHKTFVHGKYSHSNTPTTQVTDKPELSNLEERVEKLEYITGLAKMSKLEDMFDSSKPLTDRVTEVADQLNRLTEQLADLSSNTASNKELSNIGVTLSQLTRQLRNSSKWFEPVRTVKGTMSRLEDELSNKAQNTRVNALDNRLRYLEKESKGNVEKCIKDNEVFTDAQIKRIIDIIYHVVDKLTTSLKQFRDELREQKQVTDWIKREYNLRPIRKSK